MFTRTTLHAAIYPTTFRGWATRRLALLLFVALVCFWGPAALAADPPCTDGDGDLHANCPAGCDPTGLICGGDCDDGDANNYPGNTEICDGQDNNCNGIVDGKAEGVHVDGWNPDNPDPDSDGTPNLVQQLGKGETCAAGVGVCFEPGSVICSAGAAVCSVDGGTPGTEGPYLNANCDDLKDNDCDGKTDYRDTGCQGAEICDHLDNDGNGTVDEAIAGHNVGDACTSGVGQCANAGVLICDGTAATKCSAHAASGQPEKGQRCSDLIDNDCDGLTDRPADPDCCDPTEVCDEVDNNCDGAVDEGFAKGDPCSVGTGACKVDGVTVCNAQGNGVVCDATIGLAATEGPSGTTCSDGKDNDCDGSADAADTDCGSANMAVTCALPFIRGMNGDDCNGWHTIQFQTVNAPAGATVTAEMMGLDTNEKILGTLPVKNGDRLHTKSSLSSLDSKIASKFDNKGIYHEVFAPVPLLRVTVKNDQRTVTAYCSNIPYLDVVSPSDAVVSASEGDKTAVEADISRVDPTTLAVKVDGVLIFSGMTPPIVPLIQFPTLPGVALAGDVMIHAKSVHVSDVRVDASCLPFPKNKNCSVGTKSANTLTLNLEGLGGGGHIVVVTGKRQLGAYNGGFPPSSQCFVDDLKDKGVSSVLEVKIASPVHDETGAVCPVHVTGEARHGKVIRKAVINGYEADASMPPQAFTPGDGENSADNYVLPIDEFVPCVDLKTEFTTGNAVPGFDPGSNRLFAQVSDMASHTAFDGFFFAVGNVQPIPSGLVAKGRAGTDAPIPVQNAYTLAMGPNALDTFFDAACDKAGDASLKAAIESAINGVTFSQVIDSSCDPTVTYTFAGANVDIESLDCGVTLADNVAHVGFKFPDISFNSHIGGYCEETTDFGLFEVCWISLTVNADAPVAIKNMALNFDVTENAILNKTPIVPVFSPGTLEVGTITSNTHVGCFVGFLADVFEVLTFGLVDLGDFDLDIPALSVDLNDKIGLKNGDPFTLDLVKYSSETLADFSLKLTTGLKDVQINPQGLTAAYEVIFESTSVDPEVKNIPGTPVTDAPLAQPPLPDHNGVIPGADELTILMSDDVFNQLFAGITRAGKLKTLFQDVRPLNDYLPADCSDAVALPTAEARGFCKGVRCVDDDPTGLFCCIGKPASEYLVCAATHLGGVLSHISEHTPIILHGRVDVPPKMEIDDDADGTVTPNLVDVKLRLSQTSISMIADRDLDGTYSGTLEALGSCFKAGTSTNTACSLFEACANVTFRAGLQFLPTNPPGLHTEVDSLTYSVAGGLCGGAMDPDCPGDPDGTCQTIGTISGSVTLQALQKAAETSTPDLVSQGMNLGGLVVFKNPRLIAVDYGSSPNAFDDYIGITGGLESAVP